MATSIDPLRLRHANAAPLRPDGAYVLYWMIAARRLGWSHGLDHAVDLANELGRPLVILEALRCGYEHASERMHRFVIDGMADHARLAAGTRALYLPYVEPEQGAGRGLLEALAADACGVVTDEWSLGFLPRMVRVAADRLPVRLDVVDGLGILPLAAAPKTFTTAFSLRAFLQKNLTDHLARPPRADPLSLLTVAAGSGLAADVRRRWPAPSEALLRGDADALAALPIDHAVAPVSMTGGDSEGARIIARFVDERLGAYDQDRNQPAREGSSGLSPWLHFGHVGSHQVLTALTDAEGWSPRDLTSPRGGKREGWWHLSPQAEAFLDQLVTWRELGHVFAHRVPDCADYETLPGWAIETLEAHASDPREHVYDLDAFDRAETHDALWNAAQRQLVREGRMHNYLRMLWGKKILEWTEHPRIALDVMLHLNDRYAVDGRDPNSVQGVTWVLGRFDRAWGPERAVFGKVRYMSSANTARKLDVKPYLAAYGADGRLDG